MYKNLNLMNSESYITVFFKESIMNFASFLSADLESDLLKNAIGLESSMIAIKEVLLKQLEYLYLNKRLGKSSITNEIGKFLSKLKFDTKEVKIEQFKPKNIITSLFDSFYRASKFLTNLRHTTGVIQDIGRLKDKVSISNRDSNTQTNKNNPYHIEFSENTNILISLLAGSPSGGKDEVTAKINDQLTYKKIVESRSTKVISNLHSAKAYLKKAMESRSVQLFTCIFCRSVLKVGIKTHSNCTEFNLTHKKEYFSGSSDLRPKSEFEGCSSYSYFYCYTCKINPCTKCIPPLKNNKCASGHLMFKTEFSTRSCSVCIKSVKDGFSCSICDIDICTNCYEVYCKPPRNICSKCKYDLTFSIPNFNKCSYCSKSRSCHWSCFFCEIYQCTECVSGLIEKGTPNQCTNISKESKLSVKSNQSSLLCGNFHKIRTITQDRSWAQNYSRQTSKDRFKDISNTIMEELKFCMSNSVSKHCSICLLTEQETRIRGCMKCQFYICLACVNSITS